MFAAWSKWLGDQWSIGDWAGLRKAFPAEVPSVLLDGPAAMVANRDENEPGDDGPPRNLREYDPEWGRAFASGSVTAGCDHAAMLAAVRVPVLFTHHARHIDPDTGHLIGAIADVQARRARDLIEAAGQPVTYHSFPGMPHSMHGADPALFTRTIVAWAAGLISG
ncbi:hypothetical protein GCM10027445_20130 [Amycolatopsis endophytica]|uniref:Pimeloyl-ACP methyl ester carboxylesterase n=1 Tax=Amycolatopsis endophytica TaxID=860233 RepID=A0A853BE94_9PSEU|nr:hypothetical protein [Amycolatopsis endophytica]NYI93095.1 pimeloyl-ACP methyl ester carboxylesterase [Amycolatopsis endophytica]